MGRPILSPGKKLTGEKTDRYTGSRGSIIFFMLKSTEYEIYPAYNVKMPKIVDIRINTASENFLNKKYLYLLSYYFL